MIVEKLTIGMVYTYNLGNYSNVKPECSLTVQVESGDNLPEVIMTLQDQVRGACLRQIDCVLEENDEPAKFSNDPRWTLYVYEDQQLCLLLPENLEMPICKLSSRTLPGYRLEHLERFISDKYAQYEVFYEGEVDIPDVKKCFYKTIGSLLLLGVVETDETWLAQFPPYLSITYGKSYKEMVWEDFVSEMRDYAKQHDLTMVMIREAMDKHDLDAIPAVVALKSAWEAKRKTEEANQSDDDNDDDDL